MALKGFDRVYFIKPQTALKGADNFLSKSVHESPFEVLNGVKTVLLLIKCCGTTETEHKKDAVISAYYPVSNAAYFAAKQLANAIIASGANAVCDSMLAVKAQLKNAGIGKKGRNSLIFIPGLGSLFTVQILLTDLELEADEPNNAELDMCLNCGLCEYACPTGAIKHGMVDAVRCLRAYDDITLMPKDLRQALGNRLLGCDTCQSVCPLNKGLTGKSGIEVDIKPLIYGDVGDLTALIGKNYARKTRLKHKAMQIAVNLNRSDLYSDIIKNCRIDNEFENDIIKTINGR